jgi:NAD(P)-dependent dehydrogenase (short-subunit alcohol dehydrogenase family)
MNPTITDWKGKRVWLIGASSGIGAALAGELARRGARLAISARNAQKLQRNALTGALPVPCDVTDNDSLAEARKTVLAALGGVDLVVYLAGDYVPMRADDFNLAVAEQVINVNFTAAMHVTAAVLPDLRHGGGIAFVASVAGYRGLPKALCYGPGKAALIHFAEVLHLDLAPKGIGVWVINPGFVATPLTAKNDFQMPALQTPEQAANATVEGFKSANFEIHFPKRFTRLMKLLAVLPYRWYFPLIRRLTGG